MAHNAGKCARVGPNVARYVLEVPRVVGHRIGETEVHSHMKAPGAYVRLAQGPYNLGRVLGCHDSEYGNHRARDEREWPDLARLRLPRAWPVLLTRSRGAVVGHFCRDGYEQRDCREQG